MLSTASRIPVVEPASSSTEYFRPLLTGDRSIHVTSMMSTTRVLTTQRLTLRPWRVDDAQSALDIFGHDGVTRWLSPDMDRVPDLAAMRLLLQQWIAEDARLAAPAG